MKQKKWISDVVIGSNFYPFASSVMNQQTVHYQVSTINDPAICFNAFYPK